MHNNLQKHSISFITIIKENCCTVTKKEDFLNLSHKNIGHFTQVYNCVIATNLSFNNFFFLTHVYMNACACTQTLTHKFENINPDFGKKSRNKGLFFFYLATATPLFSLDCSE